MASAKAWAHPCLTCGACCAYFRVSFYWREAEGSDTPTPVPPGLYEDTSDQLRCMKGTNEKRGNRCIALDGQIGINVRCSIYDYRPTPCREFEASFSNGIRNKRCDEARLSHRLKPLQPQDWQQSPAIDPLLNSATYDPLLTTKDLC